MSLQRQRGYGRLGGNSPCLSLWERCPPSGGRRGLPRRGLPRYPSVTTATQSGMTTFAPHRDRAFTPSSKPFSRR